MHVVICNIKPEKGLIELFVIAEGRQITAVWMPKKYPDRARIEKIVRGKALHKGQFIGLATAIPAIIREQVEGKTVQELMDMVGASFHLDWNLEAPQQTDTLADW
jgi:hypothetical protein